MEYSTLKQIALHYSLLPLNGSDSNDRVILGTINPDNATA